MTARTRDTLLLIAGLPGVINAFRGNLVVDTGGNFGAATPLIPGLASPWFVAWTCLVYLATIVIRLRSSPARTAPSA